MLPLPHRPSPCPADGWNPWTFDGSNSDTTYEWEVVTSPGLTRVASSSAAIVPATTGACSEGDPDTRGCAGIETDVAGGLAGGWFVRAPGVAASAALYAARCSADSVAPASEDGSLWPGKWAPSSLPTPALMPSPPCHACRRPADGRYQVIVVAYNQYGFKRSAASNIVAVGAPDPSLQPLAVWAGDGADKVTVRFPTPAVSAGQGQGGPSAGCIVCPQAACLSRDAAGNGRCAGALQGIAALPPTPAPCLPLLPPPARSCPTLTSAAALAPTMRPGLSPKCCPRCPLLLGQRLPCLWLRIEQGNRGCWSSRPACLAPC